MPHVFVHGVPEVDAIWQPLIAALADHDVHDVICLSPPGFGAPLPAGWEPSMDAYVRWLIDELEPLVAASGPVDLVGHDWGAGHVLGSVLRRPDLTRTWATDVLGLIHPDYVWHDAAQAWQTPEVGEQVIAAMVEMPLDDKISTFAALGLDGDVRDAVAEGLDADMGRCILALYRDAAQPAMAELGARFVAASLTPGLGIVATADAYVAPALCRDVVHRVGAAELTLDGRGHWWMLEDPEAAAQGLVDFWSTAT